MGWGGGRVLTFLLSVVLYVTKLFCLSHLSLSETGLVISGGMMTLTASLSSLNRTKTQLP